MQYYVDHHFMIGKDHKICEDYSISERNSPHSYYPYIILADGCSDANHSDLGSRILTHLTRNHLKDIDHNNVKNIENNILNDLKYLENLINLKFLHSTLIYAFTINDKTIDVIIYGDGNVIIQNIEGIPKLYNISYTKYSSPDYLLYKISKYYENNYNMSFEGNEKILNIFDENSIKTGEVNYKLFEPIILNFEISELKSLSILSDGIESFSNGFQTIDVSEIFQEIVNFKNHKGSFVERRLKRFSKNMFKKSFVNKDDLSMATIYIEHKEG